MSESPHIGSVKPGPATGAVLYVLLGLAAAIALLGDRLAPSAVPVQVAAATAFGIFLAALAVYRFALVRAGVYPLGKALYQVGAGVLLLLLLVFGTRGKVAAADGEEASRDLRPLLQNPDPAVRRLACEVARYRPDSAALVPDLQARARGDLVKEVRGECVLTLHSVLPNVTEQPPGPVPSTPQVGPLSPPEPKPAP
jgi:hypothetical protein